MNGEDKERLLSMRLICPRLTKALALFLIDMQKLILKMSIFDELLLWNIL